MARISHWMSSVRFYWIIFASVLAAIITPTIDLVNWAIVFFALVVAYELVNLIFKKLPSSHSQ